MSCAPNLLILLLPEPPLLARLRTAERYRGFELATFVRSLCRPGSGGLWPLAVGLNEVTLRAGEIAVATSGGPDVPSKTEPLSENEEEGRASRWLVAPSWRGSVAELAFRRCDDGRRQARERG